MLPNIDGNITRYCTVVVSFAQLENGTEKSKHTSDRIVMR